MGSPNDEAQIAQARQRHRKFKRMLMNRVFTGMSLIGLIPFTQKHGGNAVELVPSMGYLAQRAAKEAADHG